MGEERQVLMGSEASVSGKRGAKEQDKC